MLRHNQRPLEHASGSRHNEQSIARNYLKHCISTFFVA